MTDNALNLTPSQWAVLRKVLAEGVFQNIIGGETWSLTEVEEETLWDIIKQSERADK